MKTIGSISNALARAAAAFALSLSTAAPVGAADWFKAVPAGPSSWNWQSAAAPASYVGEFGGRLWFGRARTAKDLFDTTGTAMVSRLDYYDLNIFTGEAFSRLDGNTGWFLKGYAGGGGLLDGTLKDEDFEPFIVPYSATTSEQRDGSLLYGSIDAGFKLLRGPDFHVGGFVGYHFVRNTVQAFGCAQIATNPFVCGGGIPTAFEVIAQTNNWHSLRVGVEASVEFDRRFRLTVDAAWLPYVSLYGADTHHLRIGPNPGDFTGPIPEDGKGWGYQIDVTGTWRVNDWLSIGGGGRYWHAEARATPISKAISSASTRCRSPCAGRPTTSAALSRPASSSGRIG